MAQFNKCCGKEPVSKAEKVKSIPKKDTEDQLIYMKCETCGIESPRLRLPYPMGMLYPHLAQLWRWRLIKRKEGLQDDDQNH